MFLAFWKKKCEQAHEGNKVPEQYVEKRGLNKFKKHEQNILI